MKKVAYLDCPTGIAGDMCLGALVDLGVPLEYLIDQLGRLGIAQEYRLWTETVHRNGQRATKFHVDLVLNAEETTHSDAFTTFDHEAHQGHVHSATEAATSNTSLEPLHPKMPHYPPSTGQEAEGKNHFHPHSHGETFHRNVSTNPPSAIHHSPDSRPPIPDPIRLSAHVEARSPIAPTHSHPPVRHLPDIEHLILHANLPPRAEAWSLAVFRKLAEAEGAVHGVPPEQVHFHEVGATDALVDIIGTCLGLDWLGIDYLYCSALPTGGGRIRAAHGRLPVPTPAVLKLFEMGQVPIYSNGIDKELVTPTGAAIATTLATQFGPPPPMVLHKVGLGAGTQDLSLPNILRLWIGEAEESGVRRQESGVRRQGDSGQWAVEEPGARSQESEVRRKVNNSRPTPHFFDQGQRTEDEGQTAIQNRSTERSRRSPKSKIGSAGGSPEGQNPSPSTLHSLLPTPYSQTIAVLETQIDDLNPQAIAYVLDVLLQSGALDVFTQAIGMKKSRPGVLLTVICLPEDGERCEAILFRETTTLGIRRSLQERQILPRELQSVETDYGLVQVKVAWAEGRDRPPTNVQPEYEDCARLAQQFNQPWREVHRAALESWRRQNL